MNNHPIIDVIIIGGGAAGLMAAISANQNGKTVLLLEKNERLGLKILISGGGRCNFTNAVVTAQDYFSGNPHFCKSALSQFTPQDFLSWVEEQQIPYYEKTLGQLFCQRSSKDILNLLLNKLSKTKTQIKTKQNIEKVYRDQNLFSVLSSGILYQSPRLIIATGGLSYADLGASDFGYRIAQQFGHALTPLAPALDGFVFRKKEKNIFLNLPGVSCLAKVTVNKKEFTENILFTHVGLSGPAILKASLFWFDGHPVSVDFMPQHKDFDVWWQSKKQHHAKKKLLTILNEFLSESFAQTIVQFCQVGEKNIADFSKNDAQKLKSILKEFCFIPEKTVGYHKAEVTRGGIETTQVSSQTLESKIVPGLYFVGEVLDVTGLLGGYNFQWAWSSGWVAGKNV